MVTVDKATAPILEGPEAYSPIRVPHLRIRNAGQSEGASHSARVSKHQADVCGHGGRIYRANLGGPGGE